MGGPIVAPRCDLPATGPPRLRRSLNGEAALKDKELEDVAWRLIAEAEGAGNPNRRRRLVQEAFKLAGCAGAVRAERESGVPT